jgi:hypothetical protein
MDPITENEPVLARKEGADSIECTTEFFDEFLKPNGYELVSNED